MNKNMKSRTIILALMAVMLSMGFSACNDDEKIVEAERLIPTTVRAGDFVDLGLPSGTLWATMNVGAESPEDVGAFFAWGETTGYKTRMGRRDPYKFLNGGSYYTKYSEKDGKTELEPEDDAATALWGKDWETPSDWQLEELRYFSKGTGYDIVNGVNGLKFYGKNNTSIFLPLLEENSNTTYQTRSISYYTDGQINYDGCYVLCLIKGNSYRHYYGSEWRQSLMCIRPVRKKKGRMITGEADNIEYYQATLSAYPQNLSNYSYWRIIWGTHEDLTWENKLGYKECDNLVTNNGKFSVTVSNLETDTKYYYRTYNSFTDEYGDVKSFTTQKAPQLQGVASDIGSTRAIISTTVKPPFKIDGCYMTSMPTDWDELKENVDALWYMKHKIFPIDVEDMGNGVYSGIATALSPNTKYYYVFTLYDNDNAFVSNEMSFTTGQIQTDEYCTNANDVSFKMIKVGAGTFKMGQSADGENVNPVHSVTLHDYYIGETEVTEELYDAVMGQNTGLFSLKLPKDGVSWNACQTFIEKLNQLTGQAFRLPTEAEWEFAAKGGTSSRGYIYSGSNERDNVAWNDERLHNVATKDPNELGIYDMSGNVFEWCHDFHDSYNNSAQTNPTGPTTGYTRVIRGYDKPVARGSRLPTESGFRNKLGFRLALSSSKLSFSVGGVLFNMIQVGAGTFQMGSTMGRSDEQPVHDVTLSPFYIGETEVTQELYYAVMGLNPSYFKGKNLPMEQVSWDDCQTFIQKLNDRTGQKFRLPTEAEWEFAAKGGNSSRGYIYSGSNEIDDVAWYMGNSDNKTHNVATKTPNELGIYDMTGNVFEWCHDFYGSYNNSAQTNPIHGDITPGTRVSNVIRGGGWGYSDSNCRITNRGNTAPENVYFGLGFRLALSE